MHNRPQWFRCTALLLASLVLVAGCSTTRPLRPEADPTDSTLGLRDSDIGRWFIYRMKNGEVIEVRSDTRRSRPGKPAMVEYLVIESPHRPHFAGNMTSMKLNGFYKAVEAEVTAAWKAKKAREAQRPDDKPPTPGTLIGIFIDETLDTVQDAYTRFTEKPS